MSVHSGIYTEIAVIALFISILSFVGGWFANWLFLVAAISLTLASLAMALELRWQSKFRSQLPLNKSERDSVDE